MSHENRYNEPSRVDPRSALYDQTSWKYRYEQDDYRENRYEEGVSRGRGLKGRDGPPRGGHAPYRNVTNSGQVRGPYNHLEHSRGRGRGKRGRGGPVRGGGRENTSPPYRTAKSQDSFPKHSTVGEDAQYQCIKASEPHEPLPHYAVDRPETPSLTSQQSAPSQIAPSSPPNPNALDSLDKLLQFKANVDAKRQSIQTDFEPGQLALVAQSFLQAKSGQCISPPLTSSLAVEEPEPGEVFETPEPETDPTSRAAMLKASLLLKKRKLDHSEARVKIEPHTTAALPTPDETVTRLSKKQRVVVRAETNDISQHEHAPSHAGPINPTEMRKDDNRSREFLTKEDFRPTSSNFVPSRFRISQKREYDTRRRSPSPHRSEQSRRLSGPAENLLT